jgi:NitT/TauT family transport system permease protein
MSRGWLLALQVAALAALVGAWALLADSGLISPTAIAGPAKTFDQIRGWVADGSLWPNVWSTLQVLIVGYGAGVVVGVGIGVAIGVLPLVRLYLEPFIVFFNAVPRLVLLPFFVVWLGFGLAPRMLTVFLVIVFGVAVTVQASVEQIPREYVDHAVVLGARRIDLARDVYLPAIGIWVVASARVGIGLAFQAAIVSEFFGATQGLGFFIIHGEAFFDAGEIYAAIAVTVILALVIDALMSVVDRRVRRWMPQPSARA